MRIWYFNKKVNNFFLKKFLNDFHRLKLTDWKHTGIILGFWSQWVKIQISKFWTKSWKKSCVFSKVYKKPCNINGKKTEWFQRAIQKNQSNFGLIHKNLCENNMLTFFWKNNILNSKEKTYDQIQQIQILIWTSYQSRPI